MLIADATGSLKTSATDTILKTPKFDNTTNLTIHQRTLLRLHHRFGHHSFQDIQTWAREGCFNIPIDVSTCKIPTCLACKFGDAKKNPHNSGETHSVGPTNPKPGDFVSVDTMEAGIPGYIPFTSGKPSNRRYTNSTVWVMVTPTFWPYAISHAARIHDHSPQRGKHQSPFELFTNETDRIIPNNFHVFGCPVSC
jgi:hypothetical protein